MLIDNAEVLCISRKVNNCFINYTDNRLPPIQVEYLSICHYINDEHVYLFFCNKDYEVEQDDTFDSLENAKIRAREICPDIEWVRNEFVIDGNNFDDIEGFYCEIDRLLTKDLNWKTGHNLNAFNDILRGGFGVHKYGTPILLIWKNFNKSKKELGDKLTDILIEIILDNDNSGHDCQLKIYE